METIITLVASCIAAAASLITAGAASVAAWQYWESRRIKKGLEEFEWDVLKAVSEHSAGSGFAVELNDLMHYIKWSCKRIEYSEGAGWDPIQPTLRFSINYMSFCEVLVSRGYLLCLKKDRYTREYELSPEGVRFLFNNSDKVKNLDYTGKHVDRVKIELERRRKVNIFSGAAHPVGEDSAAVDLIKEFPPAEHDFREPRENPCNMLALVATGGNKSLIEARIGLLTVVEIGRVEESLYLYLDAVSDDLQKQGKLACYVAYKHRRTDGLLDIWLCDDLGAALSGHVAKDDLHAAFGDVLLNKQNNIRDVYYRLPPLASPAYDPVPG